MSEGDKLHVAARRGDVFALRLCLKRGVPVDYRDKYENSALHIACRASQFLVVKVLVENNAFINAVNDECSTPLHEACHQGSLAIVRYLLENKASVSITNKDGGTPLHWADSVEIVEVLIEFGAVVNATDSEGATPLHNLSSDLEITKLLIKHKASVKVQDDYGYTPAHSLLSEEVNSSVKEPVMDLFLEEGLDINGKDNEGGSLLHRAVVFADVVMTQYLLDHGADVDARDQFDKTALDYAGDRRFWNHIHVIYKQVLKLKLVGIEVKEDIESINLTPDDVLKMDLFRKECEQEIEDMKSTMVKVSASLYSLLLDSPKPHFLQDEELATSLEDMLRSPSFLDDFPLYGHILRNILNSKKQSRFYLLYLAFESFGSCSRKVHWRYLPDLARDKILDYLGNKDLKNFSDSAV